MDWWLLTFILGAILSLFSPIVPDLFYLFLFLSLFILCVIYKPLRRSSGLFLGAMWLTFSGWQYQTIWHANQIQVSELSKQPYVVMGEVINLPTYKSKQRHVKDETKSARNKEVSKILNKDEDTANKSKKQVIKKTYRFDMLINILNDKILHKPIKIRLRWDSPKIAIKQGQSLQLKVKIKPAHGLANIGGFSYQAWLLEKGIAATGYVKSYIPQSAINKGGEDKEKTDISIRQILYDKYTAILPEHTLSPLLLALSFGERSQVSPQLWEILKATGTQHLIAISGLHLGLVAAASFFIVSGLLRIFPFAWLYRLRSQNNNRSKSPRILTLNLHYLTILISLSFTLFYAYLADFSLPTVRALVMIFLYWFSKCIGIHISLVRWLLLTIFIIVVSAPLSLISSSFWLSFYAVSMIFLVLWRFSFLFKVRAVDITPSERNSTGSLSVVSNGVVSNAVVPRSIIQNMYSSVIVGVKSLFIIQCALTLCLLPLTVLFFQQISLVGFIANLVAVPGMSLVIIPLCLFSVLILPFSESISRLLMEISLYCLEWLWQGLAYLTSLPHALISLSMSQSFIVAVLIFMAIIYVFSFSRLLGFRFKHMLFFIFICIGLGCSIVIYHQYKEDVSIPDTAELTQWYQESEPWQVNVLDVGQGLAVIIQRGNKAILYDTGAAYPSGFNMAETVILPYLADQGISSFDKVIISHSDNDHAGGIKLLQKNIEINHVVANIDTKYFMPKTVVEHCLQGQLFTWQGLTFTQLWPKEVKGKDNDDSCVIQVSDGLTSFLLTGDISKKIENQLVNSDSLVMAHSTSLLKSTILIVPHHGSKTSSSMRFIKQVAPSIAIFSAGYLNRWQMPVKQVVQRYHDLDIATYNTATAGMIRFTMPGGLRSELGSELPLRYTDKQTSPRQQSLKGENFTVETYRDDLSPYWFMNSYILDRGL